MEKCKFGAVSLNEYGVAEIDEENASAAGHVGRYVHRRSFMSMNVPIGS